MDLNSFIIEHNGKPFDFDGSFPNQCVDIVKEYARVIHRPIITGSGKDWARAAGYPWIDNTATAMPNPGDIVVWNKGVGMYGHVAIAVASSLKDFQSFDQNWPIGTSCHIQKHNYNNVVGWLRIDQSQGGNVTQDQKDLEKAYVLFEYLFKRRPSDEELKSTVQHYKGIIAAGSDEVNAWHQIYLENKANAINT